ncbi:EAL domain-containing protein [Enterobacter quasiroggenkampii]|uniref:EAL domain-containing protein n=1 Tax=Enterobacter quasiroggenkampii TaxID=2497436 RepID=UPI0021D1D115|nr:EAL domain-containing protein [Enterobacter quasiroggenkampii]
MMTGTRLLRKAERFFSNLCAIIRERILSAELAGAEFVPHIQPICRDDKVVGGEVLLRVLKKGVLRTPEKYLALMEPAGVINDVTCSLLASVREEFEDYRGTLPDDFYLSFNICAHQLNSPQVIRAVADFNEVFRGRIGVVLEIVERGTLDLDDFALDAMHQLTEAGVQFAIDDFGSGSASLKYIEHAGFTTVKIDRCLTVISNGSLVYSAVLDSISHLSQALGIQIIAEGIETEEQFMLLKRKGIRLFQGYHFSRPESIARFVEKYIN